MCRDTYGSGWEADKDAHKRDSRVWKSGLYNGGCPRTAIGAGNNKTSIQIEIIVYGDVVEQFVDKIQLQLELRELHGLVQMEEQWAIP